MSRTCRIFERKLKTCPAGHWAVVAGGDSPVQGLKGCFRNKRAARRARQRIKTCSPRDARRATIWVVKWRR
jgi:hypothetical protein